MPAQLMALTEGANILIDKPILLLGRHPECDIQIESRKISRRHCCIAQVEDYLVVRDLGSTNGIRINGVRVLEGKLRPSDELTIGNVRYKVRWETIEQQQKPREMPRVDVVNDDALESCEDPIPLAEPRDKVGAAIPKGAPAPPARSSDPHARPEPMPAIGDLEESIIIPENLQLAPRSDVIPPKS